MLYKLFKRESPAHPWIPVDEGTDLAELITQGEILDIYGERGQRWRFLVEDATGKKVAGNPDLVYRATDTLRNALNSPWLIGREQITPFSTGAFKVDEERLDRGRGDARNPHPLPKVKSTPGIK